MRALAVIALLGACWMNPAAAPIPKAPAPPQPAKPAGLTVNAIPNGGMISDDPILPWVIGTAIDYDHPSDFWLQDCAGRVHMLADETATGRALRVRWDPDNSCVIVE